MTDFSAVPLLKQSLTYILISIVTLICGTHQNSTILLYVLQGADFLEVGEEGNVTLLLRECDKTYCKVL